MTKEIAFVGLACGRQYLSVAGICVAMEGDICRSSQIPDELRERRLDTMAFDALTSRTTLKGSELENFLDRTESICTIDVWTAKNMEWVAKKIQELI